MNNKYIHKGEQFLENCLFDGLAHSYDVIEKKYVKPYPEVTGYIITYFCNQNKINKKMIASADYLVEIQVNTSFGGGWSSFFQRDHLYTFDTAQILIGLCSLYKITGNEIYLKSAIKGGDFLQKMQMGNGAFVPIYNYKEEVGIVNRDIYSIWNGPFSGLMCKLTEAYNILFDVTGDLRYKRSAKLTSDFYESADYIECTHPMGYWLEGLIASEKKEKVNKILQKYVIPRIQDNGYIPYHEKLSYAYVSGTIQLGIILFKLGYREYAKKIRNYARIVQSKHSSGGLFQYADAAGNLDNHIHTEINSWGTKYFCELESLIQKEGN